MCALAPEASGIGGFHRCPQSSVTCATGRDAAKRRREAVACAGLLRALVGDSRPAAVNWCGVCGVPRWTISPVDLCIVETIRNIKALRVTIRRGREQTGWPSRIRSRRSWVRT